MSKESTKGTKRTAKSATANGEKAGGFTDEERGAMKERARELKAEARANNSSEDGEREVLAKIAEMPEPDRIMATRVHEIIRAGAPSLTPRTWYGMPAYAREGRVICFFQSAHKFKARYATLGFNDGAHLDDGAMWPVAFALKELTPAEEARIIALVKRAEG
jgi:uncharacterized protein YdhG (YjbR/CyaY superfamily)